MGRWDLVGLRQYLLSKLEETNEQQIIVNTEEAKEIAQKFGSGVSFKTDDHLIANVSYRIREALNVGSNVVRGDFKNKVVIIYAEKLKYAQARLNGVVQPQVQSVPQEPQVTTIISDTNGVVQGEKEKRQIEQEIGEPTGQKFYHLEILEDVGHPLVPRVPEYIPKKLGNGMTDVEYVTWLLSRRKPVLLKGHAGQGKNHLIEYIAMKTNRPVVRFNLDGGTEPEDMVGFYQPKNGGLEWRDGLLTIAVRKGYIVVLDEINAAEPEVLFILHPLLEDTDPKLIIKQTGEVIRPHPEFRVVATMNPTESGQYGGTKDLNAALLSRFWVVETDWPDTQTEIKILRERTGIDYESAKAIVKLAQRLRQAMEQDMLRIVVGTRDLIQISELYTSGLMDLKNACKSILLGKASIYERQFILDQIENAFKPDEGGE